MEKQLPKNWVECELFDISNVITGKKDANHSTEDGQYTFFTCAFEPLRSPDYAFEDEVLILPGNGANVGHVFYFNGKFQAYQRTYIVEKIKVNSKYLYYHFLAFWRLRNENEQFGTATNYIKIGNFQSYKVDLSPLAEQNRIVAKLDSLFAQMEMMKTSMANIPVLLKNLRQQVLTQAVTGKLTESWRVGKELEEWRECVLLDVINEKPRNGFSPKAVDYETPVKSLSLSATTSGKFNPLHVKYLDVPIPNEKSHLWLKKNDILIQRSNSLDYVGTAAVYDGSDFDFIYPDIMMKIRANDQILNGYLFSSLSSPIAKNYFKNNASGTAGNMPKINQETVSKTPINLPTLLEQQEIVSRVESLFAKADTIEKQYKILKEKIDNLPQAMLHKAFKGELVEQLDNDGDARKLLKEIQELRAQTAAVGKKKVVKKKVKVYKSGDDGLGMVAEEKYK